MKMNEACGILFDPKSSLRRITVWGRTVEFSDMCLIIGTESRDRQEIYKGTYNLFGSEAARQAYRKLCKHGRSPSQETSVNVIIHSDAVLTDVVDSSKIQLSIKAISFPKSGVDNTTTATIKQKLEISKMPSHTKGGQFHKNLLEDYRIFFVLPPSTRFEVNIRFRRGFVNGLQDLRRETSMLEYESDEKLMNNEERNYMIAIIMPSNGNVYIALLESSFSEYICHLKGVVHDCYILRSQNIIKNLSCFQHVLCNDVMN